VVQETKSNNSFSLSSIPRRRTGQQCCRATAFCYGSGYTARKMILHRPPRLCTMAYSTGPSIYHEIIPWICIDNCTADTYFLKGFNRIVLQEYNISGVCNFIHKTMQNIKIGFFWRTELFVNVNFFPRHLTRSIHLVDRWASSFLTVQDGGNRESSGQELSDRKAPHTVKQYQQARHRQKGGRVLREQRTVRC
jgi:hypothetical protein